MKQSFIIILISILFSFHLSADNEIVNLIKSSGTTLDYPKADLLVIFDSTSVSSEASGLGHFNYHKLYKVLTKNGAKKLAVINNDYDPLNAFVEFKSIRVYRTNGEIDNIDISKVYDYPKPARSIYWGARKKMIEVGRLEPGDAVEVITYKKGFTYALLGEEDENDEMYIPPMRGHFYDIVPFWVSYPTIIKVYEVNIPNKKELQYQFFNKDIIPSISDECNGTKYCFTDKDLKPFVGESRMVSLYDVAPKLILSTTKDWKEKSRWFYGVNEDFESFKSNDAIKIKVRKILKGATDEMDSVARLTHWVADEIRYSGISMGEGEGFTLHPGPMTYSDKCGVCKDKAGMLITMLRVAGFESYAAMTMAGSKIDAIPADHFNHSVTAVRLSDGKFHMLDPTWVPFVRELWSSAEQQQNYLIGTAEGEELAETPLSPPENHYVKINSISELLEDGTLNGILTITAEGQSDASFRKMFTRSFKMDWDANIEKQLLRISPMTVIEELNYGDPIDYTDPILITIKYSIPDYATVSSKEIIFTPISALNIFPGGQYHLNFNTKDSIRDYGFKDRCSRLVEINETLTLPSYSKAILLPKDKTSEGDIASFKGGYVLEGQTLSFSETIRLSKRVYEASDWPSYSAAVALQKEFTEEKVILGK